MMLASTSYQDAILRPASAEIGVLFPTHQAGLDMFLFRKPATNTGRNNVNDVTRAAPQSQERANSEDVLVRLPALRQSKWKVTVLQRWVGQVEQLKSDRFVGLIVDATNSRNPAEEVEFDLGELSESDRPLLAEGATFYWSIGYRDTPGGQRERVSSLRFARQPRLSEADVKQIFEQADRVTALLESD